jgi:hypothetical protein
VTGLAVRSRVAEDEEARQFFDDAFDAEAGRLYFPSANARKAPEARGRTMELVIRGHEPRHINRSRAEKISING